MVHSKASHFHLVFAAESKKNAVTRALVRSSYNLLNRNKRSRKRNHHLYLLVNKF